MNCMKKEMSKTPEEIKKGMECCIPMVGCDECPYRINYDECDIEGLQHDSITLIQHLEFKRDAAITIMREFAARINSGEDVSACEYCNKEFGECNCNCLKEFELRYEEKI